MLKTLLCSTALCILPAVALAGDGYQPSPAAKYFNWAGTYGGVWIGAANIDGVGSDPMYQSRTAGAAGAYLGHNWQHNNIVFGVEADFGGTPGAMRIGGSDEAAIDYYGSVRARLGITFDRVLFYGTAGLGVVHAFAFSEEIKKGTKTLFTPAVGLGAEYALTERTVLRIESLNYNFRGDSKVAQWESGEPIKVNDVIVTRVGMSVRF